MPPTVIKLHNVYKALSSGTNRQITVVLSSGAGKSLCNLHHIKMSLLIHWAGRDFIVFALPSDVTPWLNLAFSPFLSQILPSNEIHVYLKRQGSGGRGGGVFLCEKPGHVCSSPTQFAKRKKVQKEGPGLYNQKVTK